VHLINKKILQGKWSKWRNKGKNKNRKEEKNLVEGSADQIKYSKKGEFYEN
jgi:hypothetical protein